MSRQISLSSTYTPLGAYDSQKISFTWSPDGPPTFTSVGDVVSTWVYLTELTQERADAAIDYSDLYEASVAESKPKPLDPSTLTSLLEDIDKPITKALTAFDIGDRDLWWYVYVTGLAPYHAMKRIGPYWDVKEVPELVETITDAIREELRDARIIAR